ncbi:YesL family protein [Radiobacillus sp. PE A8.2]|uniref:YesL family protein n=1 Tax=Radiobacillus sp. PE A8.2 TaxID=3380349 RepID=UPI00388E5CE7
MSIGINSWFYRICEWITRLVYVNLLWIGFSLLGLLLFGIGPATSSMFTVVRKWVMGEEDIKVFSTFWHAYKKDFWQANILVWLLLIGGFLLYIDYLFIGNLDGWLTNILSGILLFLTLLYIVTLVFIFPVFVSFQLQPVQYLKYALHFGVSSPLSLLLIIVSGLAMYYLIMFVPAVFPFLSGSVISLVIMKQADQTYKKIENKLITST